MIRVIDLTQHVAGPFATMTLAELGADVIKVEPPGAGDPRRATVVRDPDDYSFDFLNRRKRSVTLNISSRRGRELLLRLAAEADAVVENFAPGTLGRLRLSYRSLRRANPDIVLTSISNFGQTGPRRDWQATELVLQAMGGIVAGTGWDDAPPKRLAGFQACYITGLNAATATLAAIYGVQAGTQGGVHIDVSIQETLAPHWARHIAQYVYSGTGMRREQRTNGRQSFPHTAMAADGWLYILALYAEWEALAYFLGLEQFITHEWSDPAVRVKRWDEIEPAFRAAIASRGKYEWFTRAAEEGYTFAPIEAPEDVLAGPQAAARGFLTPATLQSGRDVPCPGLPFAYDTDQATPNRAPRLGEHNDEIFGGLLGLDADERAALHAAGII